VLAANKRPAKQNAVSILRKKHPKRPTKGECVLRIRFFIEKTKRPRRFVETGFLYKTHHRSTRTSGFEIKFGYIGWCDEVVCHIPMTTSLSAISSYRNTKAIDNPHRRMISNDSLNALYVGLLDEDLFGVKKTTILMMTERSTTTSATHAWHARKQKRRGSGTFF
jgi:hypothetical protein